MLRSARDKDIQSLDVYSDDEDNTALAGRRNMLGEINAASRESSEIRRATPGRQPVTLRQRYWKDTHLWPARIVSVLCSVVIVSFIAVLISFLYIVLKGNVKISSYLYLGTLLMKFKHVQYLMIYALCIYA